MKLILFPIILLFYYFNYITFTTNACLIMLSKHLISFEQDKRLTTCFEHSGEKREEGLRLGVVFPLIN